MRSARCVGRSFFPLDKELGLLSGNLSPYVHESVVRLGSWIPFGPTAEILQDLLGVQISKAQVRRTTEAAGAAYVAIQSEAVERIEREAPAPPKGADKMVFSVDGAMIPLRHGEWAEVKTLVIGEVPPAVLEKGEKVVHARRLSYFSRLTDAEQFGRLSLVEMYRRGVEHAQEVAAVMDGAEWEQGYTDYHCPQAERILDFAHAGQRIGQVGQALWGEGTPQTRQWTAERLHQLKHQGPDAILSELSQLKEEHPDMNIIHENLAYLQKRQTHMRYPQFQQQGWPIGSGMVESGNKLVVEARMKGAGMHWQRDNVNPMLALRNIVCSDRWREDWPLIAQQLRQQTQERRNQNREKRYLAKSPPSPVISEIPCTEQSQKPIAKTPKPAHGKPTSSGSKKPAPNHPWRHSPIGRALYQPSKNAKNEPHPLSEKCLNHD